VLVCQPIAPPLPLQGTEISVLRRFLGRSGQTLGAHDHHMGYPIPKRNGGSINRAPIIPLAVWAFAAASSPIGLPLRWCVRDGFYGALNDEREARSDAIGPQTSPAEERPDPCAPQTRS